MEFTLKKITDISELEIEGAYISMNRGDINRVMEQGLSMLGNPVKVTKVHPDSVEMKFVNVYADKTPVVVTNNSLTIMNIYKVETRADFQNEIITLKRRNKKLEKTARILNKVVKEHNINTVQVQQNKTKSNKQIVMRVVERFEDVIFDVPVTGYFATDRKKKIRATITGRGITVTAYANCHSEDIFDYNAGKKLAYARVITKFMEKIM